MHEESLHGQNRVKTKPNSAKAGKSLGIPRLFSTPSTMSTTLNNQLSEELRYNGDSSTPTHLHLCSYDANGLQTQTFTSAESLKAHLHATAINWVQVHGLKDTQTVQQVCQLFGIDFLTTQDILNADHPTKVEIHETYNLFILKELVHPVGVRDYEARQFAVVQGERFLLTFQEEETEFLNDILTALQKNTLKIRTRRSDFLLSVVLNSVMTAFMAIISSLEDDLEEMEERVLSSNLDNAPAIEEIQQYRRHFRLIKKCILPLKEQIGKLFHGDNELLHDSNRPFFNDVNDHLQFVIQTLDGCRDMLSALVELYLSNNDQRMNGIMKQLTVVSTIFIPLTFLAGIWGMNFQQMPELQWRYGYPVAWGLMLSTAVAVYFYFKRKKWY